MKYTVITPTLGRQSLEKTCASIDIQTADIEHILMYDGFSTDTRFIELKKKYEAAHRKIYATEKQCNDYGHTPRNMAWEYATGDYITYQDDDDYYADNAFVMLDVLIATREKMLGKYPTFVVFPALRMGVKFFYSPASHGRTVSTQYLHKRVDDDEDPIKFGDTDNIRSLYGYDGVWIEKMTRKYDFAYIDCEPLTIVTGIGNGRL